MPPTTFLALSRALTAERLLDENLASEFHERIAAHYGNHLTELLNAFEARASSRDAEAVLKDILEGPKVEPTIMDHRHRVARAIVWVWYTGQFHTPFEVP